MRCQSSMCATSGCMFPQACPNDRDDRADEQKSQTPHDRQEHLAKVRNAVANLKVLKVHLWNYVGDPIVDVNLAGALHRLSRYDTEEKQA